MKDPENVTGIIGSLEPLQDLIVREEPDDYPGTYAVWAESVGHGLDDRGTTCKTCGWGITCPFAHFWDAMVATVVRELDRTHVMIPRAVEIQPGVPVVAATEIRTRTEDEELNDPFELWGATPSYRCFVTRHEACEDSGCTCSCGHQEPVCACSTRELDDLGKLVHVLGCPAGADDPPYGRPMHPKFREHLFEEMRAEED